MKMNRQMRDYLGKKKYAEFEAAEDKHQFFFRNFIDLFDFPMVADKMVKVLIADLNMQKKNPSLSAKIADAETFKMVEQTFDSIETKIAAIEDYEKFLNENLQLIHNEAEAIKYIDYHRARPTPPSEQNEKYNGLDIELKKPTAKKIYDFSRTAPYEAFFKFQEDLKNYPKLAMFLKDILLNDIENENRSYKDNVNSYNFETKRQCIFSFGWYSNRNEHLKMLVEKINEAYKNITSVQKTSQLGDDKN